MADKRIRVTTDTSAIDEVRRSVRGLEQDVRSLNEEMAKQPSIDRPIVDRTARLDENKQDLEELNRRRSKIESRPINTQDRTELDNLKREIDRLKSEIENASQPARPTRSGDNEIDVDADFLRKRIEENKEDIKELSELSKDTDVSTQEGRTEKENFDNEIARLKNANRELFSKLRDFERNEDREGTGTTGGSREERSLSWLRKISAGIDGLNALAVERNGLLRSSGIGEDEDGLAGPVSPIIPPSSPTSPTPSAPTASSPMEQQRNRWLNAGTGTTSILVGTAVDSVGRMATARNSYEGAASAMGSAGAAVGGTISSIGNAFGPIGGAIGGIIGGLAAGAASVLSSYASRVVAKTEELERNVLPYIQLTGVSQGRGQGQAFREGSYAASALGMDVGQYLSRRAELLRSSGGRILGGDESREANSLLGVQRYMGLENQVLSQLQGSMRFSNQEGDLTTSSSVIRVFEETMRRLQIPFSEIASTIDESLSTFNKVASNILDKAGEFDAGKIATTLTGIRLYTGMEGRQLERVQQAVTGQNISQDNVTQALLQRTVRELFPEANTLSAVQEKIEQIGNSPELQRAFLDKLVSMTETDEQLIQIMKAVYTNLTYSDIRSFVKGDRTKFDTEELFGATDTDKFKDFAYDKNIARQTVGAVEAATAEKSNKDAAQGANYLPILTEIDTKLQSLITAVGGPDAILKAMDKVVKTPEMIREAKKETINATKYTPQTTLSMTLVSLIEKIMNQNE